MTTAQDTAAGKQRPLCLYVAGPMTGKPWHNFPSFDVAVDLLAGLGIESISPAELDDPADRAEALCAEIGSADTATHTWGDLLARDVKIVADVVDGVALLPGWEGSRGAKLEAFICRLVGKPIFYINDWLPLYSRRSDWPPEARVAREQVHHDLWPRGRFPQPSLIELDDAELDRILTVADLEVLMKIERDT